MGNVSNGFDYDASYNLYLDEYGYIMHWVVSTEDVAYTYAYAVENTGRKSNQWQGALGLHRHPRWYGWYPQGEGRR